MIIFRKYLKYALMTASVSMLMLVFSWTAISLNPDYYNPDNMIIDEGKIIDNHNGDLIPRETAHVRQRVRLVFELDYDYKRLNTQSYEQINQSIYASFPLELDFHSIYHSKYAPFIEMVVNNFDEDTFTKLKILSNQPDVFRIYIDRNVDSEVPTFTLDDNQMHVQAVAQDTYHQHRSVVRVGIFEARNGLPNAYSSVFNGLRQFEFHHESPANFDGGNLYHRHGNQVAEIIATEFGSNQHLELYYAPTAIGFFEGIDWFVDQGVEVINLSFSHIYSIGDYHHRTRYMDYITYHKDVVFVVASGNRGQSDGYVTPPATGYNSLAIGAVQIEQNDQNQTKYKLAPYSSYRLSESFMNSKPNMVALGSTNSTGLSGTSFAAPRITAQIAKLISYHPHLRGNVPKLFAIMHAASTHKYFIEAYDLFDMSGLELRIGAGMFDMGYAEHIIYNQQFNDFYTPALRNTAVAEEIFQAQLMLTEKARIIFAVVSMADIKQMSANPTITTPLLSDYVIYLFKDGKLIYQTLGLTNIEILSYVIPIGKGGLYDVVVHRRFGIMQTTGNEHLGIAYRITSSE